MELYLSFNNLWSIYNNDFFYKILNMEEIVSLYLNGKKNKTGQQTFCPETKQLVLVRCERSTSQI